MFALNYRRIFAAVLSLVMCVIPLGGCADAFDMTMTKHTLTLSDFTPLDEAEPFPTMQKEGKRYELSAFGLDVVDMVSGEQTEVATFPARLNPDAGGNGLYPACTDDGTFIVGYNPSDCYEDMGAFYPAELLVLAMGNDAFESVYTYDGQFSAVSVCDDGHACVLRKPRTGMDGEGFGVYGMEELACVDVTTGAAVTIFANTATDTQKTHLYTHQCCNGKIYVYQATTQVFSDKPEETARYLDVYAPDGTRVKRMEVPAPTAQESALLGSYRTCAVRGDYWLMEYQFGLRVFKMQGKKLKQLYPLGEDIIGTFAGGEGRYVALYDSYLCTAHILDLEKWHVVSVKIEKPAPVLSSSADMRIDVRLVDNSRLRVEVRENDGYSWDNRVCEADISAWIA